MEQQLLNELQIPRKKNSITAKTFNRKVAELATIVDGFDVVNEMGEST